MWSNLTYMVATNISSLYINIHYYPSSSCSFAALPSTTTYYCKKVIIHFSFEQKTLTFKFDFRLKREPDVLSNSPQKTSDFEYVEVADLNQLSNRNLSTYPK